MTVNCFIPQCWLLIIIYYVFTPEELGKVLPGFGLSHCNLFCLILYGFSNYSCKAWPASNETKTEIIYVNKPNWGRGSGTSTGPNFPRSVYYWKPIWLVPATVVPRSLIYCGSTDSTSTHWCTTNYSAIEQIFICFPLHVCQATWMRWRNFPIWPRNW